MKISIFFLLMIFALGVNGQVAIGTSNPNLSAQLDVTSTLRGFLPPRMTAVQRDAISAPAAGLMVWCSNCGINGEIEIYNGIAWTNFIGSSTSAVVSLPELTSTFVTLITSQWAPSFQKLS